jgi:hypothetical protein
MLGVHAANSRAQLVHDVAHPSRVHRDSHGEVQLRGSSRPTVTSEPDPSAAGYRRDEAALAVNRTYPLVSLVSYEDGSDFIDCNSDRVGELGLASG